MLADFARDLMTKTIARIEHREHQAFEFERRPQLLLDALDGAEQRSETFERVVLALHRDQHGVGSDESIKGK